jgi:Zn-dependent M16 (insulinase) family peptidase
MIEMQALDLLGTYLTSSSAAPLNKEYIEVEAPLWYDYFASNSASLLTRTSAYIYFAEDTRATRVYLPIYIGSVPTDSLDGFYARFRSSLQRIVDAGLDMSRMLMIINRDERQVSSIVSRQN